MAQTKIGAAKTAAKLAGITLEQYLTYKLTKKKCTSCKLWLDKKLFGKDSYNPDKLTTKCNLCKKKYTRKRIPPELHKPKGPMPKPFRNGDKKQARQKINQDVFRKRIPNPNSIPCFDCQHFGEDKRHEYDHYLGYDENTYYKVQSVCTICHKIREWERIKKLKSVLPTINTLPLEYKIVPNFENYRVGNDGTIWSNHKKSWNKKIPDTAAKGHQRITLYGEQKKKRVFVHRLVLEIFIGPPPSKKHQCSHLDDNPKNNCLQNLSWATIKENNLKRYH